jgi:hypothetical protein
MEGLLTGIGEISHNTLDAIHTRANSVIGDTKKMFYLIQLFN